MAKIIIVRHGHVEGIEPARFRGRRDLPLSEQGLRQARAAAACIAQRWRAGIVYASPLERCVRTGREIATASAIPLSTLDSLTDLDYGAWEWRTEAEVRARWPELLERWLSAPQLVRFPQGESLQELVARVADALRLVLERHADETVVLVTHESGIRALMLQLLEQPLSAYRRLAPQPCSLTEVDIRDGGVRVLGVNETRHLQEI